MITASKRCFFFSSRRRHTRCSRDWSSDVCSSDLLFPLSVYSIPNKAIWPYVQQWHLDVQKELPSHFVATVSYVGSKGTHLTQQRNLNQLLPVSSGNPFAAGQPITSADCNSLSASGTLANGTPVTGQAATNLGIACGNDPNPSRPNVRSEERRV